MDPSTADRIYSLIVNAVHDVALEYNVRYSVELDPGKLAVFSVAFFVGEFEVPCRFDVGATNTDFEAFCAKLRELASAAAKHRAAHRIGERLTKHFEHEAAAFDAKAKESTARAFNPVSVSYTGSSSSPAVALHRALDLIVAQYIAATGKLLTKTSVMDLLIWHHSTLSSEEHRQLDGSDKPKGES